MMDRDQKRELLAQADETIVEARWYISRQRLMIARLSNKGQAVTDEMITLEAMQSSLRTLERMREHLEIELDGTNETASRKSKPGASDVLDHLAGKGVPNIDAEGEVP